MIIVAWDGSEELEGRNRKWHIWRRCSIIVFGCWGGELYEIDECVEIEVSEVTDDECVLLFEVPAALHLYLNKR